MPNVIHFMDLEEMIPELNTVDPVRIAIQVAMISNYIDNPNAARYQTVLVVRQINITDVFSWSMPFGDYDIVNGQPMDVGDGQAQAESFKSAEAVKEEIIERLLAQDEEFDIKPGLIDIGLSAAMHGFWSYLDLEEVIVDGDDSDDIGQVRDTENGNDVAF